MESPRECERDLLLEREGDLTLDLDLDLDLDVDRAGPWGFGVALEGVS